MKYLVVNLTKYNSETLNRDYEESPFYSLQNIINIQHGYVLKDINPLMAPCNFMN